MSLAGSLGPAGGWYVPKVAGKAMHKEREVGGSV